MKINKELSVLPHAELLERLQESRKELLKFRVQAAAGTIGKNVGKLKLTKRTIARIMALLGKKGAEERR